MQVAQKRAAKEGEENKKKGNEGEGESDDTPLTPEEQEEL